MGNGNSKAMPAKIIRNSQFVTDLSNYLQKYANHFLYQDCRLSISVHSLQIINELLSYLPELKEAVEQRSLRPVKQWKLRCGLVTRLDANVVWDIDLISNIIRSVTYVQITGNDNDDSQVEVDLSNFLGMKKLDLRGVSIQMVRNIRRCRGSLVCISVSKCLPSLGSLFEECGWDQSFASNWNRLEFANLRDNKLTQLDNSLRLLNVLTVLDLSRNFLENLDALENLHCLKRLNVSYNYLRHLPCLSKEQKLKLEVFLISSNLLESLTYICDFKNLSILDARNNMITLDADIDGLSELEDLRELRLIGNPISFDKNYRLHIVTKLSFKLLPQHFMLDGLHLSKYENSQLHRIPPSWWPIVQSPIPSPVDESIVSVPDPQPSSLTTEETVSAFSSLSRPPGTKKRSRIVRLLEDEEKGDSRHSCEADVSSSEPENFISKRRMSAGESGPESNLLEEARRTRERIEQLKQSGDTNWLTNLNRSLDLLGIPSPSNKRPVSSFANSSPSLITNKDDDNVGNNSSIKIYPTPDDSSSSAALTAVDTTDSVNQPNLPESASLLSIRFLSCLTCNAGFLESKSERILVDCDDEAFLTTQNDRGELYRLVCPYCHGHFLKDQQRSAMIAADDSANPTKKEEALTTESNSSPQTVVDLPKSEVIENNDQVNGFVTEVTPSYQVDPVIQTTRTEDVKILPDGSPGYSSDMPQIICGEDEDRTTCKFYVGSCSTISDYCGSPTYRTLAHTDEVIGEEDEEADSVQRDPSSFTFSSNIEAGQHHCQDSSSKNSPNSREFLPVSIPLLGTSVTSTSSQGSSVDRYFNAANPNIGSALSWIEFDFSDFSHLDHNLQLYLDVTYLQKGEDLKFVLKTFSIPPGKIQSTESIVLVTDQRLFLLEVKDHSSNELDKCIKLLDKSELENLHSLESGYFEQSFVMEFFKPHRKYLFIPGDEKITRNFIKQFLSMYQDVFLKIYSKRCENLTKSAHESVNTKLISRFISSLDVSRDEDETADDSDGLGEGAEIGSKIEKAYLVKKNILTKGKDKLLPKGCQWCYLVLTPTHLLTIVCKYSSKHDVDYVLDRCIEMPMIASASCGENNQVTVNPFDSNDVEPLTVTFLSSHTRHFALTYLSELWSNIFRVAFEII